jgi:hypothetical protein
MLKPLVVALSLAVSSLLVGRAVPLGGGGGGSGCGDDRVASASWSADEFERHIFFSVLEGLYVDGVSNEAVDAICAIDPVHGYTANFVWNCPVCMPAYEAFRVYRSRPTFKSRKTGGDTFGDGLKPEELARITTGDVERRQTAIMELVSRWMSRRVEMLRLTPDERAKWEQQMQILRKKGMSMLYEYREQGLGGSYAAMKDCPFCDAANEPFGR